MSNKVLLTDQKGGVLTLTLNRPEVMNSLNFKMLHALKNQIETVQFQTDIRVLIITGAGQKAFSAGADLKERITLAPEQVKEFIHTLRKRFWHSVDARSMSCALTRIIDMSLSAVIEAERLAPET